MQLKTNRLLIRELLSSDWKAMQNIAADFRTSKYAVYDIPLPTKDDEIKALTERLAESKGFFAVLLGDTMIGYLCFHEANGNYDLGFCYHSDYHGKGYAYESCLAAMNFIAKEKNIKTFTAGTALKNTPSCKLLEKLGFILKNTETVSFHKDSDGNAITFEGGVFVKNEP